MDAKQTIRDLPLILHTCTGLCTPAEGRADPYMGYGRLETTTTINTK